MTIDFPELKQLSKELAELKAELAELKDILLKKELAEWFNDEECWRLKGGCALTTYRNTRFYQCKGGIPDSKVGGRRVWSKESVLEWLPLTDEQLIEYHKKYKTGAKK